MCPTSQFLFELDVEHKWFVNILWLELNFSKHTLCLEPLSLQSNPQWILFKLKGTMINLFKNWSIWIEWITKILCSLCHLLHMAWWLTFWEFHVEGNIDKANVFFELMKNNLNECLFLCNKISNYFTWYLGFILKICPKSEGLQKNVTICDSRPILIWRPKTSFYVITLVFFC